MLSVSIWVVHMVYVHACVYLGACLEVGHRDQQPNVFLDHFSILL